VNALISAVVVEPRGIYMSSGRPIVKKYPDRLVKFNDQIAAAVAAGNGLHRRTGVTARRRTPL